MGTIEKRGKNSWRVGVKVETPDGWRWVRDNVRCPDGMSDADQRKMVEVALARLIVRIDDGEIAPEKTYTVRTFYDYWIASDVVAECSENTIKNYKYFSESRILPLLGDLPIKKLNAMILQNWLKEVRESARRTTALPDDQLKNPRHKSLEAKHQAQTEKMGKPLSPRTVRHYYDTLKTMLDFAVRMDVLPFNPISKVKRPVVKKSRVKCLSDAQAVALLRCLADEPNLSYRAGTMLALLCGLRLGEVGALNLYTDVDWELGTIDITRALKYTPEAGNFISDPKSDSSVRLISLPVGMMTLLHEARAYQEDCAKWAGPLWKGQGWVMHGWNGLPLHHDTPSKWFRKFADKHGYTGVRFHDLRHAHASILLANNVDVVAVASRMGHSSPETTLRIYAHALRRRDEDAARVAQSLLDHAGAGARLPVPDQSSIAK